MGPEGSVGGKVRGEEGRKVVGESVRVCTSDGGVRGKQDVLRISQG